MKIFNFSVALAAGFIVAAQLGRTQDEEPKPVRGEDMIRVPAVGDGLSVSNVFQNHMVIQRDKPIAVWGWAAQPGASVTVTFAGQSATAKAGDDRAWKLELPAVAANSEPQTMEIAGA